MSTKDKPLSRIDVAAQPSPPAPSVNRVRFNPYTGALLKSDQPSFGKYSVFVSSGPAVHSEIVRFKRRATSGTYNIQIPIPIVNLNVKNPNFEIKDVVLYLALDDDEFDKVSEDNSDMTIMGKYIKVKPTVTSEARITKSISVNLNTFIVALFQKYTIEDFLELITGESISNSITLSDATLAVRRNLEKLTVFAEAGFLNNLEDKTEYFFLRNKVISNFTFDARYLDNPSFSFFKATFNAAAIELKLSYTSLKTIVLDIYASSVADFSLNTTTFVKTLSIDATTKRAYKISIPLDSLPIPKFNTSKVLNTDSQLTAIMNSRKYIAVKVRSVVTTANISINNPADYFSIGLTSRVALPTNAPKPNHATSIKVRFPYVLNLIGNFREFYVYYNELGTNLDTDLAVLPKNIKGLLIKYVNSPNTASNTMRFYPMSKITKIAGEYSATTKVVTHYLRVIDYMTDKDSKENTFKQYIPYTPSVYIYGVDNYYQVGATPLIFTDSIPTIPTMYKYDLTNYLSDALKIVGHNLVFNNEFIRRKDKALFLFDLEYAIASSTDTPISSLKFISTARYRITYNHFIGYIRDDDASIAGLADSSGAAVPAGSITTSAQNSINTIYKYRAKLVTGVIEKSPFTTPYTISPERQLGIFTKTIDNKGNVYGS